MAKKKSTDSLAGSNSAQAVQEPDAASPTYVALLTDLKARIRTARIKAALAANTELVQLYFEIGQAIAERQQLEGWGKGTIERLSRDLRREFPDMKGFSPRNLLYMKQFARAYAGAPISQQPVAKLPWGHNLILIDRLDIPEQRAWYARMTLEHGWSRDILSIQIETRLYERQVEAPKLTNFRARLPQPHSDLAEQTLKDPYIFDFLSIGQEAHEREIERALVQHITRFLLELGAGFAFVGRQYHLEIGGQDFFIDLLFYHLKLRSYVVVELKTGAFKPADAGQLNFYLSAIDDQLRHPADNPTIGLILCKDRNRMIAEYALRDIQKPMGISEYRLVEAIPEDLKTSLPTIEELEQELGGE